MSRGPTLAVAAVSKLSLLSSRVHLACVSLVQSSELSGVALLNITF